MRPTLPSAQRLFSKRVARARSWVPRWPSMDSTSRSIQPPPLLIQLPRPHLLRYWVNKDKRRGRAEATTPRPLSLSSISCPERAAMHWPKLGKCLINCFCWPVSFPAVGRHPQPGDQDEGVGGARLTGIGAHGFLLKAMSPRSSVCTMSGPGAASHWSNFRGTPINESL